MNTTVVCSDHTLSMDLCVRLFSLCCPMCKQWRKLHNEELRDLYSSPSIISIIKSRRMKWAGHVARIGEKKNAYRLLVGKPEGKSN
jgi:hypothetical protein